MTMPAIETTDLAKRFVIGRGFRDLLLPRRRSYRTALDGVDLNVRQGEIFGLLGPNGAGKTTLLRILSTLVSPDRGEARVLGHNVASEVARVKSSLAYVMSEDRSFYWRLTGRQNLRFYAILSDVPRREIDRRVDELLKLVDLEDIADERVMRYSSGMKQKLAIARGLIPDPEILLLDEPTRSLDPLSAHRSWVSIKEDLVDKLGKTVLIATHNMEEASFLCDRVAVLYEGKFVATGTESEVMGLLTGPSQCSIDVSDVTSDAISFISGISGVHSVKANRPNGNGSCALEILMDEPDQLVPDIIGHLVGVGVKINQVTRQSQSLSDAIMSFAESGK